MAQSVHDVASAVIERHMPIDALKLQKIIFYAAGEFAALTGETMFPEPLEAWDFGPVVHSVYLEYRRYQGESAISEPITGNSRNLNDLEIGCIENALLKYGEHSGARLIDITHKEEAWLNNYEPGAFRRVIPLSDLIESFRKKVDLEHRSDREWDVVFKNATER